LDSDELRTTTEKKLTAYLPAVGGTPRDCRGLLLGRGIEKPGSSDWDRLFYQRTSDIWKCEKVKGETYLPQTDKKNESGLSKGLRAISKTFSRTGKYRISGSIRFGDKKIKERNVYRRRISVTESERTSIIKLYERRKVG